MSITLVIGGARSGKSRFAERLALHLSDHPIYLATSRIGDADHRARIERHRADRGPEWTTLEEDKDLARHQLHGEVVVVDCVTLWLMNFFTDLNDDSQLALDHARRAFDVAAAQENDWIFVTNELGQGLHAETPLGRKFTDAQGFLNQHIAHRADRVALLVAGVPVQVKPAQALPAFPLD